MEHRRVLVVRRAVGRAVEIDLALEQAPEGPHVVVLLHMAVRIAHVDLVAPAEPFPVERHPGAGRDDHAVAFDVALVGAHRVDAAAGHVVALDLHTEMGAHAPLVAFLLEAAHGRVGAGIARRAFVNDHIGLLGVEVGPDRFEVALGVLADIKVRRVVGGVLALGDLLVVRLLVGLADRDVADLLEPEIDRVRLPDVDRMPQDRVQGAGHVEIAHAAAGNAGCARARAGLVQEHDVRALAAARGLELHRQMPRGRHAVHAGADHHIGGGRGEGVTHGFVLSRGQ